MQSDKRTIHIRRMMNTEKDMNTLLKWLSDPQVLEWWGAEDAPWDLDKVMNEFGENTASGSTVVACFILLDETPIGYMQYYPIERDSYKFNDEDTYKAVKDGYGLDMFIGEPALWGQGIGKKAVKILEKQLSDELQAGILCVDPEMENERAVHFWKSAGFIPISVIKNCDDDNKESILMLRHLHSSE